MYPEKIYAISDGRRRILEHIFSDKIAIICRSLNLVPQHINRLRITQHRIRASRKICRFGVPCDAILVKFTESVTKRQKAWKMIVHAWLHEVHGESMHVGKSGKFQVYLIKIPGVFQEMYFSRIFQGLENLKIKFQDFPGAVQTLLRAFADITEMGLSAEGPFNAHVLTFSDFQLSLC
jgi:hypothetical protein